MNRQGPDIGHELSFGDLPADAATGAIRQGVHRPAQRRHIYKAPIATRIEHGGFYPAEAYHQDFARKHPYYPYIVINDRPKVAALHKRFPSLYKAKFAAKPLKFHVYSGQGATNARIPPICRRTTRTGSRGP